MFQFRRTNSLQAARCFNKRTAFVPVALTLILLWAAATPGSASLSTAIFLPPIQTPAPPQAPPGFAEAVVEVTQRDFGDVFAGEELEHTFLVRNAGTKPLELAEKSSLGTRLKAPDYRVATALWRTKERFPVRSVAAMPVAPS